MKGKGNIVPIQFTKEEDANAHWSGQWDIGLGWLVLCFEFPLSDHPQAR
jgi:hypothetical protein